MGVDRQVEEQIIQLEMKIADQEADIAGLSSELYAQQKEIAELNRQYDELKGRIQALAEEGDNVASDVSTEPPPPHY